MVSTMQIREETNELMREAMRGPEYQAYITTPITRPRAQLVVKQLGLFVRNRRDCWAAMMSNCPLDVKRVILLHEYEELVKDRFVEGGHYYLVQQQGKTVGLTPEEMDNAVPLPTTRAAMYAWVRIAKDWPWLEGFAASSILEKVNDDSIHGGRGHARVAGENWIKGLGITWDDIENWKVHREADEDHSEMTSEVLERYVRSAADYQRVIEASRASLDLYRTYWLGLSQAMAALP